MVSDPDAVLLKLQNDFNDGKPIEVLTEGVREAIIKNVKRRMTPQPLKIRADVELTCFSYDGVLHIQVGLRVPNFTPGLVHHARLPGPARAAYLHKSYLIRPKGVASPQLLEWESCGCQHLTSFRQQREIWCWACRKR